MNPDASEEAISRFLSVLSVYEHEASALEGRLALVALQMDEFSLDLMTAIESDGRAGMRHDDAPVEAAAAQRQRRHDRLGDPAEALMRAAGSGGRESRSGSLSIDGRDEVTEGESDGGAGGADDHHLGA